MAQPWVLDGGGSLYTWRVHLPVLVVMSYVVHLSLLLVLIFGLKFTAFWGFI